MTQYFVVSKAVKLILLDGKGHTQPTISEFDYVKTCRVCGTPMSLVKFPNLGEIAGDVAVAVYGMPVLSCPQGHQRSFAYPGFPNEMLAKIFAGMPTVVERGFVGKNRFCCKCKGSLSDAMVEEGMLTVQVNLRDLESFRVEVAGLFWRCRFCRQQQVLKDRKLLSAVPEALTKGFESVNLSNR